MTITLAPIGSDEAPEIITIAWTPPSPLRRREIVLGVGEAENVRPMRVKARDGLIRALNNAHRWMDELVEGSITVDQLAARERKSERSIRMTLSLAFVAPDIITAAIEGRLPRGFGVKRLMDLPMAWSDQWRASGLQMPASSSPTRG